MSRAFILESDVTDLSLGPVDMLCFPSSPEPQS
jgi:hypothetical protein